jgi:hypothetical protein
MAPTFVAKFSDGQITRMSTFCADGKLDLGRGVRLSCAAYEDRTNKNAPAISEGHFELDGEVLKTYTREELMSVSRKPPTKSARGNPLPEKTPQAQKPKKRTAERLT